jgi:chromosome segregation ATPase
MDLIKLTEDNATLTAANATLTEQLTTAQAAVEQAQAQLTEATTNATQATEAKAAIEKEKTDLQASIEASAKEKADLLAQIETLKASQADFDKALGQKVLAITGMGGNKAVEGQHEGGGKKDLSRSEFNALSPRDQSKFALEGGKITE